MTVLQIRQIETLAEYMIAGARNGKYIVSVLFYYEAIDLMRELMRYKEIVPVSFEITEPECKGYDGEYYVSLYGYDNEYDDSIYLSVEPVFHKGKMLKAEAEVTLIDGDARSSILKDIPDGSCLQLDFDAYKEECESITNKSEAKDPYGACIMLFMCNDNDIQNIKELF